MNIDHCLVERDGPILVVTLNRPEEALMKMLREVDENFSEERALELELEIGEPVFATRDAREGPRAFAEKRKPVFRGE